MKVWVGVAVGSAVGVSVDTGVTVGVAVEHTTTPHLAFASACRVPQSKHAREQLVGSHWPHTGGGHSGQLQLGVVPDCSPHC